jgi:hypothetical protein
MKSLFAPWVKKEIKKEKRKNTHICVTQLHKHMHALHDLKLNGIVFVTDAFCCLCLAILSEKGGELAS